MKISKLFHWLYASVMLLPIFAIGFTCLYAVFNPNAKDSWADYSTTEIVNVGTDTALTSGVYYQINITRFDNLINGYSYEVLNGQTNIRELFDSERTYVVARINMIVENARVRIQWFDTNNVQYNKFLSSSSEYITPIYFLSNGVNTYGSFLPYYNLTTLVTTTGTIDNVFYYSVDKIMQSSIFSWAYDSFLVAPFAYIVSLFSMPTNSPIVMLLSYWLAISIIWLVFDLVMYVPQLVHRWLDKGVLE